MLAILIAASLAGAASPGGAAENATSGPPAVGASPLSIGVAHEIASRPLNESRMVNVVLPASYAKEPGRRYPVLYLIDGGIEQDLLHISGAVHLGALWGRSGEVIVVGLETRDRRRELTGPTSDPELLKRFPTAGSSAQFRSFIRDEVKPLVERLYRTSGRGVVMGESLAGLFVIETYLAEPDLFDAYGAVDPSLWWDKEALTRTAGLQLDRARSSHPLFVAVAREHAEDAGGAKRLLSAIWSKRLPVCVTVRRDLTHATIYQQVAPQVLGYLLPAPQPAPEAYGFQLSCADKP